jgi:hypothetical protein
MGWEVLQLQLLGLDLTDGEARRHARCAMAHQSAHRAPDQSHAPQGAPDGLADAQGRQT